MSSFWSDLDRYSRAVEKQKHINKCYQQSEEYNDIVEKYIYEIENYHKNIKLEKFDVEKYYKDKMIPLSLKEYKPLDMPSERKIRKKYHCLKENKLLEMIDKGRKEKRIKRGQEFVKEWKKLSKDYWIRENENKKKYEKYKDEEVKKNNVLNKDIINARKMYDLNNANELDKVLDYFLDECVNKRESIGLKSIYINTDEKTKCWLIELEFYKPEEVLLIDYKKIVYLKSKNEFKKIPFSEKEKSDIYNSIVFNSALYNVAEITYAFFEKIDQVIINCYVNGINSVNGNEEKKYIFSSTFDPKELNYSNLKLIDSKAFFDSVNSKYNLPFSNFNKIIPYSNVEQDPFDYINEEIDGFQFEKFSKKLLEKNGFDNVLVTKASGDYGADVIAYKDKIKYAIQCKKFSSKVGVKAVQEVMASREVYKCHVGAILTNNYFTPNAIKLAEDNKIILWNKDELSKMIDNMNKTFSSSKRINFKIDECEEDDNSIDGFDDNNNDNENEKHSLNKKDDKLEEMDLYGLEEVEREYVRRGDYEPYNFEDSDDEELDEDDYYYEDK